MRPHDRERDGRLDAGAAGRRARLLVVDDDPNLTAALKNRLELTGEFAVEVAGCGLEAVERILSAPPDLVLLDLGLPDLPGAEVFARVKDRVPSRIVFLTGDPLHAEEAALLDQGADGYLKKPEDAPAIAAHLRLALARPRRRGTGAVERRAGGLAMREHALEAGFDGRRLRLTALQARLLWALLGRPGEVLSRAELTRAGWGDRPPGEDSALGQHIRALRLLLGDDPRHPRLLVTVYGEGYRLAES